MPTTLDQLRAEAMALHDAINLPHGAALDAVAYKHGYRNWKWASMLAPKAREVEEARHIRTRMLRKIVAEYRQSDFLIKRSEVVARLAREYPGKVYSDTILTDILRESPLVSLQRGGLLGAPAAWHAERPDRFPVSSASEQGDTEKAR